MSLTDQLRDRLTATCSTRDRTEVIRDLLTLRELGVKTTTSGLILAALKVARRDLRERGEASALVEILRDTPPG
jgi:hypothetical protein